MSIRTSRWILWIGFVLLVPVPILFLGPGLVPTARLLMLGGISVAVMLVENARGAVGMIAVVLLAQGFLYMGVLWLAAHILSRTLGRFSPKVVARATIGVIAVGLLLASLFDVYRGPYRVQSARANLLNVFE